MGYLKSIVIVGFLVLLSFPVSADAPQNVIKDKEINDLILIQDNTLVGQTNTLNPPRTHTFDHRDLNYDKTIVLLLNKIIKCESGGSPTIVNPESGAWGLCQILPSTQVYVEKKWNITIDWKDKDEQFYACYRLLMEEGTKHWIQSKSCWSK